MDEIIDVSQIQGRNYDRNVQIVELARNGVGYAEIGDMFNITASAVSHIARSNGFLKRPEISNGTEPMY